MGYYPKGMGEATLTVSPNANLKPINLTEFGKMEGINGVFGLHFSGGPASLHNGKLKPQQKH
jgi:RNA 3'-terminal phosphate cyclase